MKTNKDKVTKLHSSKSFNTLLPHEQDQINWKIITNFLQVLEIWYLL